VREYAPATLGDEGAVLVIEETSFLKRGKAACGAHASILARRTRSPIAGSECSPPTCHGMAMPCTLLAKRMDGRIRFA